MEYPEKVKGCYNCLYYPECQTEIKTFASTAPIKKTTIHCYNWTPDKATEIKYLNRRLK